MKNNPATLPENEINSGKIWSLLRFNEEFEEDVNWFSAKYKRAKSKRTKQENRETALTDCHQKYEEINKINPFAGIALQWMFPMPIFIKENSDEVHSHPNSWGPIIWPAKEDKIDALKEWKEYEVSKQWVTLDTGWFSINEGFKRAFLHQYRQIDSRPLNPITKDRSDAPFPHETDFFNDLDLGALISQGDLNEEGLAKVLLADELKNKYRVFAVPRHLPTKTAIDEAFTPLIKQFKADLPKKASDPFGTKAEWKDYLAVREIQEDGSIPSKAEAIKTLIEKRHCKDRQFLVDGVFQLSDARRVYEGPITKNCKAIEGKIHSVYPDLLL
jgi:hypothetical protein